MGASTSCVGYANETNYKDAKWTDTCPNPNWITQCWNTTDNDWVQRTCRLGNDYNKPNNFKAYCITNTTVYNTGGECRWTWIPYVLIIIACLVILYVISVIAKCINEDDKQKKKDEKIEDDIKNKLRTTREKLKQEWEEIKGQVERQEIDTIFFDYKSLDAYIKYKIYNPKGKGFLTKKEEEKRKNKEKERRKNSTAKVTPDDRKEVESVPLLHF